MSSRPITFSPPRWKDQDLVLFHGTTSQFASDLVNGPILVKRGSAKTDFGPGFYTTTIGTQARKWADIIAYSRNTTPAVVEIAIPRGALAGLQSLVFVLGDNCVDFWSLIHHRRGGATDHGRAQPNNYYDVVYGPVAASWEHCLIFYGADQISFHTAAAEWILNNLSRKRII